MPEPSTPQPPVPWDPSALKGRQCQSCACYFESVNPENKNQFQGFCRRAPAEVMEVRAQVPRVDLQGRAVLKDGKPVLNNDIIKGFIYKPTQREGICFDGYRPLGTLPGESSTALKLRALAQTLVATNAFKNLEPELQRSVREAFDVADGAQPN